MEILNIGPLEIVLIFLVMLIFLGPRQVTELAQKIGRSVRKMTQSEIWTTIWQTSRDIRRLPKTIVEETGLEDSIEEIRDTSRQMSEDLKDVNRDLSQEMDTPQKELADTSSEIRMANHEMLPHPEEQPPVQVLRKKSKSTEETNSSSNSET